MSAPAPTLSEKMVDYIRVSDVAMQKAAAAEEARSKQAAATAALIPQAVDALVAGERIEESERAKAAQLLADPVEALRLLTKVAKHRNAAELSLGSPVAGNGQQKAASHSPGRLPSPIVGDRSSGMAKQSTVNLFAGLGLTPPSDE